MSILLDTNIVIEHLAHGTILVPLGEERLFVSVITEAELLRLPGLGDADRRVIEEFLGSCERLPVSSIIARRAAALGRIRKTKLPDLLIAATAMEYRLQLFTRNIKDFVRIPGLTLHKI